MPPTPPGQNWRRSCCAIADCWTMARAVQPIKDFGTPAMDAIGPMPYCDINAMLDGGFPRGALNYWKSQFLSGLSDDSIRAMIDCFADCPTPLGALFMEHFHGAVTRIGETDTSFPHRAK